MLKQEIMAGIVFCLMGVILLILPPQTLWKITDKWKNQGGGQPSKTYVVIMRILGAVFTVLGGWLLISCI